MLAHVTAEQRSSSSYCVTRTLAAAPTATLPNPCYQGTFLVPRTCLKVLGAWSSHPLR